MTDLGKIVVHDKGQVGFAAAKVNDVDFLPFVLPDAVIDDLNETVDLAEFVVHGLHNLTLFCKNSHVHKRRDHLSLL